jgi:hypothetical protein
VFLVALCLLAALVWWRVLHRSDSHAAATPTCTTTRVAPPSGLPRPANITVSVLNSTNHNGLAHRTTAALRKDGFRATVGGNDRKHVKGVAEIRYPPAERSSATVLAYYLRGAVLVREPSAHGPVVVSLGARYTRLATPAAVRAEMTAAHTRFRPTTPVTKRICH